MGSKWWPVGCSTLEDKKKCREAFFVFCSLFQTYRWWSSGACARYWRGRSATSCCCPAWQQLMKRRGDWQALRRWQTRQILWFCMCVHTCMRACVHAFARTKGTTQGQQCLSLRNAPVMWPSWNGFSLSLSLSTCLSSPSLSFLLTPPCNPLPLSLRTLSQMNPPFPAGDRRFYFRRAELLVLGWVPGGRSPWQPLAGDKEEEGGGVDGEPGDKGMRKRRGQQQRMRL